VGEPETPRATAHGGYGVCGATRAREARLLALFVGPAEEGGNELEDLEFLRVGAVEG